MSTSIGVIGLGAWGSALSLHLARAGHSLVGFSRGVSPSRTSFTIGGCDYPLPSNCTLTNDISSLSNVQILIIALPAKALNAVRIPRCAHTIISATKGIEPSTRQTPLQFFEKKLDVATQAMGTLSGPSFAADLAAGRPISVVAASSSITTADKIAELFSSPTFRVYSSEDPLGVELGGILKNVIALAAGVSDAMGLGPSARAALITRGLAEMTRLAVALGAQTSTLSGLSGLGDLIMTASDDQSRNRTVGLRLGKGESLSAIATSLGSVAEGVSTASLALKLATEAGVDTPICAQVVELLEGRISPQQLVVNLMQRPRKREF